MNANVDLDLSVPGYKYDITFTATKVPLAPLANSFAPTYRNKAQGDIMANLQIKGAGITGRNLKENLTGQASFSLTNATIQVDVSPTAKVLLTPVAVGLGAPDLLKSPIDYVNANLQFGNGNIKAQQFVAHSTAFRAESQGIIPINDVLLDSKVDQPVDFYLAQGVATTIALPIGTTTGGYTKLPTFFYLTGTLGKVQPKEDWKALAIGSLTNIGNKVGGTAAGSSRVSADSWAVSPNRPTPQPTTSKLPASHLRR